MKFWVCLLIATIFVGVIILGALFMEWLEYDAPWWVKYIVGFIALIFVIALFLFLVSGGIIL